MERLSFSTNWNGKLWADCFTTIRLYNPNKYKTGAKFEIWLKKDFMHKAIVLDVKKLKMSQLNEWICALDTGYNLAETQNVLKTMYKDNEELKKTGDLTLSYVLLKKLKG
jgi:hypothetical protein